MINCSALDAVRLSCFLLWHPSHLHAVPAAAPSIYPHIQSMHVVISGGISTTSLLRMTAQKAGRERGWMVIPPWAPSLHSGALSSEGQTGFQPLFFSEPSLHPASKLSHPPPAPAPSSPQLHAPPTWHSSFGLTLSRNQEAYFPPCDGNEKGRSAAGGGGSVW